MAVKITFFMNKNVYKNNMKSNSYKFKKIFFIVICST